MFVRYDNQTSDCSIVSFGLYESAPSTPAAPPQSDTLNASGGSNQLAVNQLLRSQDGRFDLIMQGDGNLVLYRRSDSKPLWASNTNGKGATFAVMQGDGNFVLY